MRKSADLASPGCQCRAVTYAPPATPKWPPGNSRLPSKAPTRRQFHRRGQTFFVTPLVMNAVTVTFALKPKNSRCCYLFVVVEFLHINPQQSQWRQITSGSNCGSACVMRRSSHRDGVIVKRRGKIVTI